MLNNTSRGFSPGLIDIQRAKGYNFLYEDAKERQKATFERQSRALEKARQLEASLEEPKKATSCIKGIKYAYCENQHMFVKPVFCGKEECSHCGEDLSDAHYRRINAVRPTVSSWSSLSYMVFNIPYELRFLYQDKKRLNKFRLFVKRKLKRDGYEKAVFRWHWAGDCKTCKALKKKKKIKKALDNCLECYGTGCGLDFHPHLNVLLPAGNTGKVTHYENDGYKVKADYLKEWKRSIASFFTREHKKHLEVEINGKKKIKKISPVMNYSYIPPVGTPVKSYYREDGKRKEKWRPLTQNIFDKKVSHKVRYVFRATLRNPQLSSWLSPILLRYMNTIHLGTWKKSEEKPEPMSCPCCGSELRWYGGGKDRFMELNNKGALVKVGKNMWFIDFLVPDEHG